MIIQIQVSETAISSLKAFCESPHPYKIICAGSLLGVKIRRFHSSFPVGKVRIEFMHPMDFEEFLIALGKDMNKYTLNNSESIKIEKVYKSVICNISN